MDQAVFKPLHSPHGAVVCANCKLREICLPVGLSREELQHIDKRLVAVRHKVPRGGKLFEAGHRFDAVYAVWTGCFKTCIQSSSGREQLTGFQMSGELIGLDGIGTRQHAVDAVALEDSQVCEIPFAELEALSLEVTSLQQQFYRVMSHEIMRNQGVMLLLGSMHAEKRLAAFLLNLTHRLAVRGFSSSALVLRMSRIDIGSYLGLTIETVSRTFSKLQADGLIEVNRRQINIVRPAGLQALVDGNGG